MQNSIETILGMLHRSPLVRLLLLGFIALLLLIPIAMIGHLVFERQQRFTAAVEEVAAKWGHAQALTGPALVVPYTRAWVEGPIGGAQQQRSETRYAVFLPKDLRVRGMLAAEKRQRGIFSIPVYRLELRVEGEFARPSFSELDIEPAAIAWDKAYLAVGIQDSRAVQSETVLDLDGAKIPFLPGTGALDELGPGIHAPIELADGGGTLRFSFPLVLNGSVDLSFVPFAQGTTVELEANHPDPSFQGGWLPTEHEVTDAGFRARWSIPFLGRGYPQAWTSDKDLGTAITASRFGVTLLSAVDNYRMAERSIKYAALFIVLTFAAIWLLEITTNVRVHPIQYLLLGCALCLFYLLELALSEHIGFMPAYGIASTAVVGMAGGYAKSVLRTVGGALLIAGGIAALYTYLYVVLNNDDYALLIGAIGLFLALGAIMYATRRVDWYGGRAAANDASGATVPL